MIGWLLALACAAPDEGPPLAAPTPQEAEISAERVPAATPAEANAERFASRHILISHRDALRSSRAISREEARALAEELRRRVLAGEKLSALAGEFSNDPGSKFRGGYLGSTERGAFVKEYEEAALALPIGGLSPVVESAYGFHIIQRESLEELHLRHIVVQFQGNILIAEGMEKPTRTREEAEAILREALAALEAGEPFDAVCARSSEGPLALRGCDLGWMARGELGPYFDEAVFALEPGQRTGVVESPFGLHLVERME